MGSTSSAEDCCSHCSSTSGCAGYAWVRDNQECWLKSEVGPSRDDGCGGCVTSGTAGDSPSPSPAPAPRPSPSCAGSNIQACVHACPTDTFSDCIECCVEKFPSSDVLV